MRCSLRSTAGSFFAAGATRWGAVAPGLELGAALFEQRQAVGLEAGQRRVLRHRTGADYSQRSSGSEQQTRAGKAGGQDCGGIRSGGSTDRAANLYALAAVWAATFVRLCLCDCDDGTGHCLSLCAGVVSPVYLWKYFKDSWQEEDIHSELS